MLKAINHQSHQSHQRHVSITRLHANLRRDLCNIAAPRIKTKRSVRSVFTNEKNSALTDSSHQLFEWAKARTNAMQVDVEKLDDNPRATDTALLPPWRSVLVPSARIESLKTFQYYYCSPSIRMWNIGYGRAVTNCNMYDINPGAIDAERISRRPGEGRFVDVARGAYGNRNFKYLWAIDHAGMHIAREMTPCKMSSRGIITHSILVDRAIIGGEIFFDIDDPNKVFVNFGSARLPIRNIGEAEHTAEFLLALDYRTVVAMIPNRDLEQSPYGMADRYGPHTQNMIFRCEE
ncbi:MAG: hypothetical protein ACKO5Z_10090 [Burkholderiaceae bacterium]